jgi:SnoaL-like domain
MSTINEAVVNYIAAWNERDSARRRAVVAKTWTEHGSYIDAHRNGIGHDAIDAMISQTQSMLPGYKVRLVSGIEAHNNRVRFSWAAGGTPEAPLYLAGTDFAELASDGRLQSVAGFVDAAPAR